MHTEQEEFRIETSTCTHTNAPASRLPFNVTFQVPHGRWNWLCLRRLYQALRFDPLQSARRVKQLDKKHGTKTDVRATCSLRDAIQISGN
jgi:hypothetical protein